jgi:hypothetical protein
MLLGSWMRLWTCLRTSRRMGRSRMRFWPGFRPGFRTGGLGVRCGTCFGVSRLHVVIFYWRMRLGLGACLWMCSWFGVVWFGATHGLGRSIGLRAVGKCGMDGFATEAGVD